jgi:hypothetical protein
MVARARSPVDVRGVAWRPNPGPGAQELNEDIAGRQPSHDLSMRLKRQNNRDTKQQTGERPL